MFGLTNKINREKGKDIYSAGSHSHLASKEKRLAAIDTANIIENNMIDKAQAAVRTFCNPYIRVNSKKSQLTPYGDIDLQIWYTTPEGKLNWMIFEIKVSTLGRFTKAVELKQSNWMTIQGRINDIKNKVDALDVFLIGALPNHYYDWDLTKIQLYSSDERIISHFCIGRLGDSNFRVRDRDSYFIYPKSYAYEKGLHVVSGEIFPH